MIGPNENIRNRIARDINRLFAEEGEFSPDLRYDANDGLLCPHCGGQYLHQGRVQIWNRFHEDGLFQPALDAEIPGRRQALRITFECELCPARPVLQIQQHKGATFIEWIER